MWPYIMLAIFLGPLVFLAPKDFELFDFQIVWLWTYLMMVIPETRRYMRMRTKLNIFVFIRYLIAVWNIWSGQYCGETLRVINLLYGY